MKRLSIIFIAVATMAFASCGILGGASSSSAAQSTGQTCGAAMLGLYQAYQSTGTIDLTNANNLANALALAACYSQIKQNKDNDAYKSAFGNGLILSSAGLITSQNSNDFITALLSANALANMNTTTTTNTTSANASFSPTITRLVTTLDKK